MRLIWKVLRQNISVGQLIGFVLANIIGLTIIVLGIQLYADIRPILTDKAGFMKPDYMVVSKPVSTAHAFSGVKPSFTEEEIADIRSQEFVTKVGTVTPARYGIMGELIVRSYGIDIVSDLFFESVPEDFVDVESEAWTFQPGDHVVPIILPRAYLNLYNFGYAPTSSFPAISENMVSSIVLNLAFTGNGQKVYMKGKIIGFTSRLNTILVPESFVQWSNDLLAPEAVNEPVSRVIIQVTNPTDERIAAYFEQHELNVEGDKLNASKAGWLMRLLVAGVMLIGLIICSLAAYVLMLSIFLLMQRNHEAIRNLRGIGYTAAKVSLPYQMIVLLTNMVSVLTAMLVLIIVRSIYMKYLFVLAPDYTPGSLGMAWLIVILFGLFMSAINAWIIRSAINKTC